MAQTTGHSQASVQGQGPSLTLRLDFIEVPKVIESYTYTTARIAGGYVSQHSNAIWIASGYPRIWVLPGALLG